ncbi:hypothetical protein ACFUIW_20865 [Streptomyces sp. NPDC057245]|nr:hypothetical protein [Streptomyces sp. A108]
MRVWGRWALGEYGVTTGTVLRPPGRLPPAGCAASAPGDRGPVNSSVESID